MTDTSNHADQGLVRGLGLVSSTTLVAGSMIGSGIFIVSAEIARTVHSPALLLASWIVAAIMTLIAALSYGELAAAMPHAGGQYVYLREGLSPLFGFLYGWGLFTVIQTGTVAAVCVGFAKFLAVFIPMPDRAQQATAILCILVLTAINCFGIKAGAFVQNLFTFTKTAALLGLILLGYFFGRNAAAIADNFGNFWRGASPSTLLHFGTLRILAVSMVGSLFAADAWNNITFTAGEVRNPKRNVPLSLLLGAGGVMVLYLAANLVYLNVLPFDAIQHAPDDRVGTAAAEAILGPVALKVMAAFIVISTFGCSNGLILAGARVYYAMARDGLFLPFAAKLNPRTHAPVAALLLQAVWSSALVLSGSYNQLLDYVVFAVLLFYILTIAALFRLRRTRPAMDRPYKALGYPLLPALYIVLAVSIEAALLWDKPKYSFLGLFLVLLGIPVYLWLRGRYKLQA